MCVLGHDICIPLTAYFIQLMQLGFNCPLFLARRSLMEVRGPRFVST